MTDRQKGLTTQQMVDAPPGAVYVWCNGHMSYPMGLAKKLGRDDLEVRPLSWLEPCNVMGKTVPGVVLDHAARPTSRQVEFLRHLQHRCDLVVAG